MIFKKLSDIEIKFDEKQPLLKPYALRPGDTIGVFTPSSPAYIDGEELFLNGIENLKRLGFKVKLGNLTAKRGTQGYRSGTAEDRAKEFMGLILDDEVHGLISTIGGSNSSSMLGYLDYDAIRAKRKIMCGYSDVTSLHLAMMKFAGLSTIYGPSAICWFSDWPDGIAESSQWFLESLSTHTSGSRAIEVPNKWSNHRRGWANGDWKAIPRQWQEQDGWCCLNPGMIEAPIVALNLNTMLASAGTAYFPDLRGKILLLEDMEAPMGRTERSLRQLQYLGVFDDICGLIIGKPEVFDSNEAPFSYEDLFLEILGERPYPIVGRFDCSHTVPMISIPQQVPVRLNAKGNKNVSFEFLDGGVISR